MAERDDAGSGEESEPPWGASMAEGDDAGGRAVP